MDKIIVKDLEIISCHGVNKEEKIILQPFLISLELYTDFCLSTDSLEDTVSYATASKLVKKFLTENCFDLVETIAWRTAKILLNTFPALKGVKVLVKKPKAPMKQTFDYVGTECELVWHKVYVGLGSNLGDKNGYLDLAVDRLRRDDNIRCVVESERIDSAPYGGVSSEYYVNSVASFETVYSPKQLLARLNEIEGEGGRVRAERWGNRTLDLDILFYDDLVVDESNLAIPHPDMQNREFVLAPLASLNSNLYHPIFRKRVSQLLAELRGID